MLNDRDKKEYKKNVITRTDVATVVFVARNSVIGSGVIEILFRIGSLFIALITSNNIAFTLSTGGSIVYLIANILRDATEIPGFHGGRGGWRTNFRNVELTRRTESI